MNKKVTARYRAEIIQVDASKVDYMDVSPKMVVSVATAMIPFLENDDNSRALMGSNMQKQAVPLMVTESPIVGTGMEYKAAVDSGVVVCAKRAEMCIRDRNYIMSYLSMKLFMTFLTLLKAAARDMRRWIMSSTDISRANL